MNDLAAITTPVAAGNAGDRPHPVLEISGLRKTYGTHVALESVDLSVAPGEFVSLLGPSGSGKTTLLNLIAGLTAPTAGRILIDGTDVTALPPSERGLGMVFQNYALMPHLSVFENVAFPLRIRGVARAEIRRRVAEALDIVQLGGLADRKPSQISGGQQQRVAIARCIVYSPRIILMDEPLGALDKRLRERMQLEIKALHKRLRSTIIYVTHDQQEALTLSDRVVLMDHGRIVQAAPPAQLYLAPSSLFAAEFVGDSNVLKAVPADGGFRLADQVLRGRWAGGTGAVAPEHGTVNLVVRPESIAVLRGPAPDGANVVQGRIEEAIILGSVVRHFVCLADGQLISAAELHARAMVLPEPGTTVILAWSPEDTLVFPGSPHR